MYYEIEIQHDELNKYRVVRDRDPDICEKKANAQLVIWDEMWQKKLAKEQKAKDKKFKIEEATRRTKEAQDNINELKNILKYTLDINDTVDWDSLKDNSDFAEPKPKKPKYLSVPEPPDESHERYNPKIGFLDRIFTSKKQEKLNKAKAQFDKDIEVWKKNKEKILKKNSKLEEYYRLEINCWEDREKLFLKKQQKSNLVIDDRKKQYLYKTPESIIDYCELVLSNSEYPDNFPQEFDLEYKLESGILIVEYSLPRLEVMPNLKEVKYLRTRDEIVESFLSESAINKLYDDVVYQIPLRTIHELYEADTVNAISSIIFNGWVNSIDKAIGKEVNCCILSIQANKDEFLAINLENVEPKICFKTLKGIGSSKLHSMTPVAPIIQISRDDKRFVSSYDVAHVLDGSINIAAMDWEDFEHLIRELFEKEFSQAGGEVKITRASRDGGVDAIAFDPDPIRGGKIVIQAKRYTNTVGVSAVRDLYGTVVNEGATKGILVTTADYGPDAYEFAKGKPLTLLNGGNLLHLLEKHGHKAKIDIKEARVIMGLRNKKE